MPSTAAAPLPRICYPAIWLWPGQALYCGPALNLKPHSGSVWCLAVGVDAPLTVVVDGRELVARAALIPPRLTHHLSMSGRLVSCYLDPAAPRTASCRDQFDHVVRGIGVGHRAQGRLLDPPSDDTGALRWLTLAAPSALSAIDPRIELVAKQIRDDPATVTPAGELAASVGLSESRFLHLFGQQAGCSLRRYRLWSRLLRAGAEIAAGHNLTTAAAEAGFASPSHLSDRFRATFGLSATALLSTGLEVRIC